jgi:hypothetical protein
MGLCGAAVRASNRGKANMPDISHVIGRALSDPTFCERLIAAPQATLQECGVEADAETVELIRRTDPEALRRLAAAFGKQEAAG